MATESCDTRMTLVFSYKVQADNHNVIKHFESMTCRHCPQSLVILLSMLSLWNQGAPHTGQQ